MGRQCIGRIHQTFDYFFMVAYQVGCFVKVVPDVAKIDIQFITQNVMLGFFQNFQNFKGTVTGRGLKGGALTQSRLSANEISFAFTAGGARHQFKGRVAGDTMDGIVNLAGGGGTARWSATRLKV